MAQFVLFKRLGGDPTAHPDGLNCGTANWHLKLDTKNCPFSGIDIRRKR
jgi:hypothetical protein